MFLCSEEEEFKRFYHIWAWWPSWSTDWNQMNNFLLYNPVIICQGASEKSTKIVDDGQLTTTDKWPHLCYKLPRRLLSRWAKMETEQGEREKVREERESLGERKGRKRRKKKSPSDLNYRSIRIECSRMSQKKWSASSSFLFLFSVKAVNKNTSDFAGLKIWMSMFCYSILWWETARFVFRMITMHVAINLYYYPLLSTH